MTQVSTNKPEPRQRVREARDDREPGAGAVLPWEMGRLFSQLLSSDSQGSGYGASVPKTAVSADTVMIEAMTAQLVPRVHANSQWPLQAVIHMPRLGRLNARVERGPGCWSIELQAEEKSTTRWLSGVRQRCQDEMSKGLRQPVELHLVDLDRA